MYIRHCLMYPGCSVLDDPIRVFPSNPRTDNWLNSKMLDRIVLPSHKRGTLGKGQIPHFCSNRYNGVVVAQVLQYPCENGLMIHVP